MPSSERISDRSPAARGGRMRRPRRAPGRRRRRRRTAPLLGMLMPALMAGLAGTAEATCGAESSPVCFANAIHEYCNAVGNTPSVCHAPKPPPYDRLGAQWAHLAAACQGAAAGVSHCDRLAELRGRGEAPQPAVLAFDHSRGTWRALEALKATRFKIGGTGKPLVSLGTDDEFLLLIETVNPLLYTVVRGELTEADAPQLASLTTLFGLLGPGLGAIAGASVTAGGGLKEYHQILDRAVTNLKSALAAAQCRVQQVAEQSSRAAAMTQSVEARTPFAYVLDHIEPASCGANPGPADLQKVVKAFDDLALARNGIAPEVLGCRALVAAAVAVLDGDPNKPAALLALWEAFEHQQETLSCDRLDGTLDLEAELGAVLKRFTENLGPSAVDLLKHTDNDAALTRQSRIVETLGARKKLLASIDADTTSVDEQLKKEVGDLDDLIEEIEPTRQDLIEKHNKEASAHLRQARTVVEIANALAGFVEDIDKILGQREAVRKGVSDLAGFERRLRDAQLAAEASCVVNGVLRRCISSTGVGRYLVLDAPPPVLRFGKIQTQEVAVKVDSPYSKAVSATRPAELEVSYDLRRLHDSLWGVGGAFVYSPLDRPTFGALTSESDPEQQVIGISDDGERTGLLALLFEYRWGQRVWPDSKALRGLGLELGAGIDSEDPAVLVGLSYRPARHVRLGAGLVYQKISVLADDLAVGMTIPSEDDIRTKDDFSGKGYLSLTISFDSLSLFSAPE